MWCDGNEATLALGVTVDKPLSRPFLTGVDPGHAGVVSHGGNRSAENSMTLDSIRRTLFYTTNTNSTIVGSNGQTLYVTVCS